VKAKHSYAAVAAAYAALVGAWLLMTHLSAGPGTLWPTPAKVWDAFWVERAGFLSATRATLEEAGVGFLFGVSIAVVFAFLAVRFVTLGGSLYRIALVLYSLPLIAVAPLLATWFGPGLTTKAAIAALGSFFPVVVNGIEALRSADARAVEFMSTIGANSRQVFLKVRLHYALPAIFAAFKVAGPNAFIGAMLAEWVGANNGLGLMVLFSLYSFQVARLWATLIVSTAIAVVIYFGFEISGRKLFAWHPSTQMRL
jgi:ABC-type nitrate/sulfonate/bicarbonate transport system permease component